MKSFYLVFEDLLNPNQKSIAGPFESESQETLVKKFGLVKKEKSAHMYPVTYWDGKKGGGVIIRIVLARNHNIKNPEDLQNVAHQLHCDWY